MKRNWVILTMLLVSILVLLYVLLIRMHSTIKPEITPEQSEQIVIDSITTHSCEPCQEPEPEVVEVEKVVEVVKVVKPKAVVSTRIVSSDGLADDVEGFSGHTPIEIVVKGDIISEMRILPNKESEQQMDMLREKGFHLRWNGMTLHKASTTEVDVVTGATISSRAIIENVRRAAKSAL